jgi:ABC-type amino acid transport substrate-binding protein
MRISQPKLLTLLFLAYLSLFQLSGQSLPRLIMAVGSGHSRQLREFFTNVYREAGYELAIMEYPAARQNFALEQGEVDCLLFASEAVFTAGIISRGIKIGFGSDPLLVYATHGFIQSQRMLEFKNRKNLAGLRIGYVQGSRGHEEAIKAWDALAEAVPTVESGILMLRSSRIDMLLAVKGAPQSSLVKHDLTKLIAMLEAPLITTTYYHVLHAKHQDKQQRIATSLLQNRQQFESITLANP